MATAADRLANNLNFGALGKATELRQRLLFTLGALIVFVWEPFYRYLELIH